MKKYEYTITGTIEVEDEDAVEDVRQEIPYAVDNDLHTGAAVVEIKLIEEIIV